MTQNIKPCIHPATHCDGVTCHFKWHNGGLTCAEIAQRRQEKEAADLATSGSADAQFEIAFIVLGGHQKELLGTGPDALNVGDLLRQSAEQIGGVIKIAQISGEVARIGLDAVFNLIAVLSVSIGLLNLFPIPLLDGGHLLFYSIEAVRGRPLSERAQEVGFRIGLAIVVMLMLFATFNDLRSLFPSISGS